LKTFGALNPKSINVLRSSTILLPSFVRGKKDFAEISKNLARRFENNFVGPSK